MKNILHCISLCLLMVLCSSCKKQPLPNLSGQHVKFKVDGVLVEYENCSGQISVNFHENNSTFGNYWQYVNTMVKDQESNNAVKNSINFVCMTHDKPGKDSAYYEDLINVNTLPKLGWMGYFDDKGIQYHSAYSSALDATTKITAYDSKFISGTFEATLTNDSLKKTVHLTEGEFKMQYVETP